MANLYELLYALNPEGGDEALQESTEAIKAMISEQGSVEDEDIWGIKRLAYEIDDLTEAYYVLLHFKSEPDFPTEVERRLRINDKVIRYLVTKVDEK